MELTDAIQKANRLLNEEHQRPTVGYVDESNDSISSAIQAQSTSSGARLNLYAMRRMHPRPVREDPQNYSFKSTNYDLLLTVYLQVSIDDRPSFISSLLAWVAPGPSTRSKTEGFSFPTFQWKVSALPLIAEFCIRTGHKKELIDAIAASKAPTVGLAIMMIQIEETIALNFNLFGESELEQLPSQLNGLREMAELQTYSARGARGRPGTMVPNPHYKSGREQEASQIVKSVDGIADECNQALYWYLKGALQLTPNLEIESDRIKVIGFLDNLGFDPLLSGSLAKAESLYNASSDAFDLKSCLGHIRSFYEHLNIDAGQAIARLSGATVVDGWDPTMTFLRNSTFLSPQQEKFARGLYTLLSDEGVHPLIAEREFARLLRNVVIEYGVMFLTMLQKRGVRV
jgi:hypothetical protein